VSQVVHSAGRRFIVSPVPESRLREQFFGPPSGSTSFGEKRDSGKESILTGRGRHSFFHFMFSLNIQIGMCSTSFILL